jgi:hypothetical protein
MPATLAASRSPQIALLRCLFRLGCHARGARDFVFRCVLVCVCVCCAQIIVPTPSGDMTPQGKLLVKNVNAGVRKLRDQGVLKATQVCFMRVRLHTLA